MKPEGYIELISKEMLVATSVFKEVFLGIMITDKVGEKEEVGLKLIKKRLEVVMSTIDKMLEKNPYAYIVIVDVFGTKQHIDCDSKEAVLELAGNFHGDDGKAYIFTNDITVGGREESAGGTIICETADDAYKKADAMMEK